MVASLSPPGFSTRTPLADAEVAEKMRNPHFRIGWLEGELAGALAVLRDAHASLRKTGGARVVVELRIKSIERTLRLGEAANHPAADASEKALPVAAAGVAA